MVVCVNELLWIEVFGGCREVERPKATALHILVGPHNVVSWLPLLIYMRTPPTHYYLESSGRATYMETHL